MWTRSSLECTDRCCLGWSQGNAGLVRRTAYGSVSALSVDDISGQLSDAGSPRSSLSDGLQMEVNIQSLTIGEARTVWRLSNSWMLLGSSFRSTSWPLMWNSQCKLSCTPEHKVQWAVTLGNYRCLVEGESRMNILLSVLLWKQRFRWLIVVCPGPRWSGALVRQGRLPNQCQYVHSGAFIQRVPLPREVRSPCLAGQGFCKWRVLPLPCWTHRKRKLGLCLVGHETWWCHTEN